MKAERPQPPGGLIQPPQIFPHADADAPAFTGRDFWRIVFKHKHAILISFIGVTALVTAGLLYLPPTYVAQGKILVKTEQQGTPSFFSGIAAYREPQDMQPTNRKIETEMELLSTRPLSERVVERLKLRYEDIYQPPYVHLIGALADAYDQLKHEVFGGSADPQKRGFDATVKAFNASFLVEPLKSKSADTTSNLIQISLKASDPRVAQEALLALLQEYVNYTVEQNQKLGREARRVVAAKTAEAEKAVDASQAKLRQFLALNGRNLASQVIVPPPLTPTVPPSAEAAAAQGAAAQGARPASSAASSDGSAVSRLNARLLDMELQLIDLSQVFRDDAENVQVLKRGIVQVRQRIAAEMKKSASNEGALAMLERQQRTAEQYYLDLVRKLDQIDLFLQLGPSEAENRVITEPPLAPRSSEWRKSAIVGMLGSIAGLILGLGIAGYREYSDHRLESSQEVERFLGLKALGVVDDLKSEEKHEALLAPAREA